LPAERLASAPYAEYSLNPFKAAAAASSVEAIAAPVGNRSEFDSVFAAQVHEPNGGLIVMPDSFLVAHRVEITYLAARYRLPVVYPHALFAEVDGLLISMTKIAALSALMTLAYCCRSFSGC
jgi:putative tryptophan/tyrosine transport system substrate-binding protein